MQEVGLVDVFASIEAAFKSSELDRVEALLWPALDQYPSESRLWFYGGCVYFKKGQVAVSSALFHKAIDLDDAPHIFSNLGACYRRMNLHEEGIQVLTQALERDPNYPPTLVNLGSMFVNEGCPERGIPHLEKAIAIGNGNPERGASWNLGLLYLEAGRFAEGFDLYRGAVNSERALRCFGSKDQTIPEPVLMTPGLFQKKSGRPTLIAYGEQGIGDELMMSTMLDDAINDFELVFECHPRLEKIHRNSSWAQRLKAEGREVRIYPTRKDEWINWPVTDKVIADYKMPLCDMACYYRRDLQSFKDARVKYGPTLQENQAESHGYAVRLQALAGDRPIVGLATRGGVIQTSRTYRTIRAAEIDRLMTETDALFVSLDYDDMLPIAGYIEEKYGADRYRFFPSIVQHFQYDHTAALVAACDLTLTVCQSVFHLSAGLGQETLCLVPQRCAWRYAPVRGEPELSYWYPRNNIRLLRQDDPVSWEHPLDKAIAHINSLSQANREAA